MRTITIALGICCVGLASASFDLMLLGDNTTGGAQRVVRYDPVNRVVLGSFGTGFLNGNIQDIAVDMSTNQAYVLDNLGTIRVFDYYTGDFLRMAYVSNNYNQISFDSVSNRVLVSNVSGGLGNGARAYSTSLNGVLDFTPETQVYGTLSRRNDGEYYAYWDIIPGAPGILVPRMFDVTTGLASGTASSTAPAGIMRSALIGNDDKFYGLNSNGSSLSLYSCDSTASGLSGNATWIMGLGTTAFTNQKMVWGHGNTAYILDGNIVSSYYSGVGVAGTQTLSFATGTNIRGMALVIAPEPGQFVALGLGLCGLILRRRKRNS